MGMRRIDETGVGLTPQVDVVRIGAFPGQKPNVFLKGYFRAKEPVNGQHANHLPLEHDRHPDKRNG